MQEFRNLLKGWVGKVLLAIFILPFAFFGIEGIILNSGKDDAVLTINGKEISKAEVDRAITAQRDALAQRMGGKIDASFFTDEMLRPRVIETLIQKELMTQAIKDEGLYVAPESIKAYVRTMPQFKDEKGEFSQQQLETVLARAGYTATRFFDELSNGMVAEQLQNGVGGSAFLTLDELKTLVQLDGQTRDVSFATLKLEPFKSQIQVSDEDVSRYYEENKSQYRTLEKASIQYVQFKPEDFAGDVAVSDEDLAAEYDHYVATSNEQERRRASHILVEVNDDRDDEAAEARIKEAKAKLDAGEDFATLAKTYSDDAATAEQGGDLDFAGRGVYDEAFEKALYALEQGKVSDVVKTEFGYHIIKLTGVERSAVASLEEKKEELKQKLVTAKAAEHLNEAIDELNRLAYESGDLSAIADKFGKSVSESELFTRDGGAGIAADKKVMDATFSDAVLKDGANSEVLELGDGSVAVIRLAKHEPARDQTLDEVKDQVRATVMTQNAREKAKAVAAEIVEKLRKGESLDAVAAAHGISWTHTASVNRQNAEVSRSVVTKLFELARPVEGGKTVDSTALPTGDQEIVVLTKVSDGEFKLSEDEIAQTSIAGAARFGQLDFENYMGTLKEGAEIVQQ